jgi:hypothetical protein
MEHLPYPGEDPLAVGDLLQDPDLHVIDDKRQLLGAAYLFERLGDLETVESIHQRSP